MHACMHTYIHTVIHAFIGCSAQSRGAWHRGPKFVSGQIDYAVVAKVYINTYIHTYIHIYIHTVTHACTGCSAQSRGAWHRGPKFVSGQIDHAIVAEVQGSTRSPGMCVYLCVCMFVCIL
jgi:hypothetical protein